MKRKSILAIFALIGLSAFVVLGSSPTLVGQIIESAKDNPITRLFISGSANVDDRKPDELPPELKDKVKTDFNKEVPEPVLWSVIFSLPGKLEESAAQARLEGKDDSLWTRFFIRQGGLSEANNALLHEVSTRYKVETDSLNERMKNLVAELRLQKDPTKRAELLELQKQKTETTMRFRDHLRSSIGEESYSQFERWVKEDFSKAFKPNQGLSEGGRDSGFQELPDQGFKRLGAPEAEGMKK